MQLPSLPDVPQPLEPAVPVQTLALPRPSPSWAENPAGGLPNPSAETEEQFLEPRMGGGQAPPVCVNGSQCDTSSGQI